MGETLLIWNLQYQRRCKFQNQLFASPTKSGLQKAGFYNENC